MLTSTNKEPAIWFPAIRAGTGADMFTVRLADALEKRGIRTLITWLPHRAEYLPWLIAVPEPPEWANIVHINSWLHQRFVPNHLTVVATIHSNVHDAAISRYKGFLQASYHRYWIRRLEVAAVRRANVVTAVSRYTARQAEHLFPCGNIVPIYNWIDTELFSPASSHRSQHKPFRLLFVGNAKRKLKGVDLLVDIMRSLGPEYELWFTGELGDLGDTTTLPSNIVAMGRLRTEDELVSAYRDSDALLFPTRSEGFGLVAVEAQSCGLPVIATDGSSLPEVVEQGVTGHLCRRDDVQAFVHAIKGLRNSPEVLSVMRQSARRRALDVFAEELAIEKYLELYRALCLA